MTLRREVQHALVQLGRSSNAIATALTSLGITQGAPSNLFGERCPIAMYLKTKFPEHKEINVWPKAVFFTEDFQVKVIPLSKQVQKFISRFDSGYYRESYPGLYHQDWYSVVWSQAEVKNS